MKPAEWRDLLGHDVLLLLWPLRSKGTRRKWAHLTVADMTPAYLAKLERGNIGVALGAKSGHLCALDVDMDNLIDPFITANPWLKNTLQTHGARGLVFWLRISGDYPPKTKKLKNRSGDDCGEFRSNGSQSIICGTHPSGKAYEIVHSAKPVTVDFAKIVWPTQISNPPRLESQLQVATSLIQRDRETESQSDGEPDVTDAIDGCGCYVASIEDAVNLALPRRVHQNNDSLFTLARAVKSLELKSGKFTPAQLRDVFGRWYERSAEFLRPEQGRDAYLNEFMNAYASAKVPLGHGVIEQAWKAVQERPLPAVAIVTFEDHGMRLVVALCEELQRIAGAEPFYLAARTVQRLLKQKDHVAAARLLRSLCVQKILIVTEQGSGVRASRYRYAGGAETR